MPDHHLETFKQLKDEHRSFENFAKAALQLPDGKERLITSSQMAAFIASLYDNKVLSKGQAEGALLEMMRAASD